MWQIIIIILAVLAIVSKNEISSTIKKSDYLNYNYNYHRTFRKYTGSHGIQDPEFEFLSF